MHLKLATPTSIHENRILSKGNEGFLTSLFCTFLVYSTYLPERILGPTLLMPVTKISFRQFSAVSWVHRWPSTHQSQGKGDATQEVHEEKVLQSKKVKLVDTKSGPSTMRTESSDVKWCSVAGIRGSKSFLGVVQLT